MEAGAGTFVFANVERTTLAGWNAGLGVGEADRDYACIVGPKAAERAANSGRLTCLGYEAGFEAIGSRCSVFLGTAAGAHAPYAWGLTCVGYSAGRYGEWCEQSFFGGVDAGRNAKECMGSVFIGARAGRDAKGACNAIAIGQDAVATSNETVIGNERTERATVWGRLRLTGKAPSRVNDPGEPGELAVDDSGIYVCVAKDRWMRAEVSGWKK